VQVIMYIWLRDCESVLGPANKSVNLSAYWLAVAALPASQYAPGYAQR